MGNGQSVKMAEKAAELPVRQRRPLATSDGTAPRAAKLPSAARPSPLRRRDHVCRQSRTNTPPSLSARYRSLLRRLRKGEQILDRRRRGACAADSSQAACNRALPVAHPCGQRAGKVARPRAAKLHEARSRQTWHEDAFAELEVRLPLSVFPAGKTRCLFPRSGGVTMFAGRA